MTAPTVTPETEPSREPLTEDLVRHTLTTYAPRAAFPGSHLTSTRMVRILTELATRWHGAVNTVPADAQTFRTQFTSVRRRLELDAFPRGIVPETWDVVRHTLIPLALGQSPRHAVPSSTEVRQMLLDAGLPEEHAYALANMAYSLAHAYWGTEPAPSDDAMRDYLEIRWQNRSSERPRELFEPTFAVARALALGRRPGEDLPPAAELTVPEVRADALAAYLIDVDKAKAPNAEWIRLGTRLWLGDVREGRDRGRSPVEALRQHVRNFGHTGFTGGAALVLERILATVVTEVAGTPLTAEEWRAWVDAREQQIAFCALMMGKRHGMCSQLDATLDTLSISRGEAPPREVTVEVDGYTVKVTLTGWDAFGVTDNYTLANLANQRWNAMSTQEKAAAIVKTPAVPVLPWRTTKVVTS